MTMLGYYWAAPWFFLALIVLPLMAVRYFGASARARVPVPNASAFTALPTSIRAALWWVPDALRLLAVGVLVVAMARPQAEDRQLLTGEGVDIMLCLDMSRSMNAVDMPGEDLQAVLDRAEMPRNRFEIARDILQAFIASRDQDRIGLVAFGREAWLRYPLTLDYARLNQSLEDLVLDFGAVDRRTGRCLNGCTISGAGTAIGDALGRGYNRLRRSKAKTKLMILITDGRQEGGTLDPRAIGRYLRDLPEAERVRMFTFLVGSQDQSWWPQTDPFGREMKNAAGVPIYSRPDRPFPVDPELLRELAEMTDGKYYESYNAEKFEADVRDLERTVFKSKLHINRSDVFMPLVLLGLLLLLGEQALRFTAFRSVV